MKKVFALFLLLAPITLVCAQNSDKHDQVLMLNGEEKIGTVTGMDDETVTFKYSGETLEYKIKKSDIFRIKFVSGRTELFSTANPGENGGANQVTTDKSTDVTPNSVAIIPFRYITSNGPDNKEEMGTQLQNDYYSYASSAGGKYTYQDPMKTNATLRKKGIVASNVQSYEADELCDMLGVEYVVFGSMEKNKTGTSTNANASGSTSKKGNDSQTNANMNSTTEEEYKTTITVAVYDNTGKRIFDQKKTSVWSSPTAYKSTLNYLIKRTPFYAQ